MGCGASSAEPYEDPYAGQAAIDPAFLARQQQMQMQQQQQHGQAMPMQPVAYGSTQAMAMQQPQQQQATVQRQMAQAQQPKAPMAGTTYAGLPEVTGAAGWPQPATTVQKPLGSPAREFIMEGSFQWAGGEPVPNWQMAVFSDEAGNVFGGNRADKGYEMHYAGFITEQGINVEAVFESGMTIQYEASLTGGEVGVANGNFEGKATVLAANPGSQMPAGSIGTIAGVLRQEFVCAIEFKIGGKDGWYAWDGEPRQTGFAMELVVDRLGQVFGSNRNAAAGSEMKSYRGTFHEGVLNVDAVFESGQVINYVGQVVAGMTWEGHHEVKTAGANSQAFKPVGFHGTMGGNILLTRAEQPYTKPLGMPMREYIIGGGEYGWHGWDDDVANIYRFDEQGNPLQMCRGRDPPVEVPTPQHISV